ncbi:hypothetical protein HOLleu_28591 [Holothuria leucospilota]|uniref:Uncharacterized protein n=1 Tax=Holothuria leucospilota TaxID=206669 RepID=A0A9Q1BMA2_HOLLE|nr:hypothetical protein HOLleu_28591 [Holothuria leucospilota]
MLVMWVIHVCCNISIWQGITKPFGFLVVFLKPSSIHFQGLFLNYCYSSSLRVKHVHHSFTFPHSPPLPPFPSPFAFIPLCTLKCTVSLFQSLYTSNSH